MITKCRIGFYSTVEVAGRYCEQGKDCSKDCPYSYPAAEAEQAKQVWDGYLDRKEAGWIREALI